MPTLEDFVPRLSMHRYFLRIKENLAGWRLWCWNVLLLSEGSEKRHRRISGLLKTVCTDKDLQKSCNEKFHCDVWIQKMWKTIVLSSDCLGPCGSKRNKWKRWMQAAIALPWQYRDHNTAGWCLGSSRRCSRAHAPTGPHRPHLAAGRLNKQSSWSATAGKSWLNGCKTNKMYKDTQRRSVVYFYNKQRTTTRQTS